MKGADLILGTTFAEDVNEQRGPDFTVEDPERMLVVLRKV